MNLNKGVNVIIFITLFLGSLLLLDIVNAREIAQCPIEKPYRNPQTNICECVKGPCAPAYCGDKICDGEEDISTCPEDCIQKYLPEDKSEGSNILSSVVIIGISIIIGFVVLGLMIRRKKSR